MKDDCLQDEVPDPCRLLGIGRGHKRKVAISGISPCDFQGAYMTGIIWNKHSHVALGIRQGGAKSQVERRLSYTLAKSMTVELVSSPFVKVVPTDTPVGRTIEVHGEDCNDGCPASGTLSEAGRRKSRRCSRRHTGERPILPLTAAVIPTMQAKMTRCQAPCRVR